MTYEEWYAKAIRLMPDMMIDEIQGELVISSGFDAISMFHNQMTPMEER